MSKQDTAAKAQYVEGGSLMLYFADSTTATEGTVKWLPSLGAKSHKISQKAELKTRLTKDTDSSDWEEKEIKKLSVTITVDGLVAVKEGAFGYDSLDEAQLAKKTVKVRYGAKADQLKGKYKEGLFIIESLEQTSPAGSEDTTYSATLVNTGAVKVVTVP